MSIFVESKQNIINNHTHTRTHREIKRTPDRYRDGAWISIADTKMCPVGVLKFILWAGLGNDFVFRNIILTKSGYEVRKTNKKMSYKTLREA